MIIKLLEELKELDEDTWVLTPYNRDRDQLQGCIQRAIEKRGWIYFLEKHPALSWNCGIITIPDGKDDHYYESDGDFPAEAVLAAYIKTLKMIGDKS